MVVLSHAWSLAASLLAELVSPCRCAACDAPLAPKTLFCPPCAASTERAVAPRGGHAAFEYGGAIAAAISRFKYGDRPDLGERLGSAMLDAAAPLRERIDLVVPVPLHPKRLADRGYNQAALLAAPIARSAGLRLAAPALTRRWDTPKQASLDRATRLTNVQAAFVGRNTVARGARVLLVDDVSTTGATLRAAERALYDSGARDVVTLVLARRA